MIGLRRPPGGVLFTSSTNQIKREACLFFLPASIHFPMVLRSTPRSSMRRFVSFYTLRHEPDLIASMIIVIANIGPGSGSRVARFVNVR